MSIIYLLFFLQMSKNCTAINKENGSGKRPCFNRGKQSSRLSANRKLWAEARTHFSMKGEIYWADYNQKQYLFT